MGDFRMTIESVGGHGCDRKAKEGDEVHGCGQMGCPDCLFAAFVSQIKRSGMPLNRATFHHWPADMGGGYTPEREVIDDYSEKGVKYPAGGFTRATGKRVKGSF